MLTYYIHTYSDTHIHIYIYAHTRTMHISIHMSRIHIDTHIVYFLAMYLKKQSNHPKNLHFLQILRKTPRFVERPESTGRGFRKRTVEKEDELHRLKFNVYIYIDIQNSHF